MEIRIQHQPIETPAPNRRIVALMDIAQAHSIVGRIVVERHQGATNQDCCQEQPNHPAKQPDCYRPKPDNQCGVEPDGPIPLRRCQLPFGDLGNPERIVVGFVGHAAGHAPHNRTGQKDQQSADKLTPIEADKKPGNSRSNRRASGVYLLGQQSSGRSLGRPLRA